MLISSSDAKSGQLPLGMNESLLPSGRCVIFLGMPNLQIGSNEKHFLINLLSAKCVRALDAMAGRSQFGSLVMEIPQFSFGRTWACLDRA